MISSAVVQMAGTTGKTWKQEALKTFVGGIWTPGS
jgi:hypothetical protein